MHIHLHRSRRLAAAITLACSPLLAAAQGRATVELLPLGWTGGRAISATATGINDHGQVVGSFMSEWGIEYAFLWNPGDTGLPFIDSDVYGSQAHGINNRSQVVGTRTLPSGARTTMIWSPDLGARALPVADALPISNPAADGVARAISDNGRIVGSVVDPAGVPRARIWANPFSEPQVQAAGISLRAVNDAGAVAGQQASRPYVSDSWGALQLPFNGQANGINRHGMVVGERTSGTGTPNQAFVWTRDGGVTLLPTPGDGIDTARAVSDAGQVVGQSNTRPGGFPEYRAFLWTERGGTVDLGRRYGLTTQVQLENATAINSRSQIVGRAVSSITGTVEFVPYVLTLHPDWQGGSGQWDSANHWNWGGTGVADVRVAAVHDAVIDPGRSLTVWGAADGRAKSLQLGGTFGHLVNFDVNFGATRVEQTVTIAQGGVLRGSGLLTAGTSLDVAAGGRVQVDAGQQLLLAVPVLNNRGQLRVQGTPLQPAQLEVVGTLSNLAGAQTLVQHGRLSVSNGSVIAGQLALESGQLAADDDSLVNGRLLVSFGRSSVSGGLINVGEIVVSNGAEASFYGALQNDGELRVSSGGAANFFGPVSGVGSFTGSGEARFEGGLTIGASPGVATINFNVTLNSAVLAEIGGATPGIGDGHHDKIIFNGNVRLLDAPLNVVWWGGFTGALGDRYDLFDWNGSLTGTFSSLSLPVLADGLVWDTSDLYLGGTLGVAAVPEPATWALMLAGVAGVLARRRAGR